MAPFAEYALELCPPGVAVSLSSPLALSPGSVVEVGRIPSCEIVVDGPQLLARGWAGRRNHRLLFTRTWELGRITDHLTLRVNGTTCRDRWTELRDGDRVEPARGLVFVFRVREDLAELARALESTAWRLGASAEVLLDWVMERTGFDRAAARLAVEHLSRRR